MESNLVYSGLEMILYFLDIDISTYPDLEKLKYFKSEFERLWQEYSDFMDWYLCLVPCHNSENRTG